MNKLAILIASCLLMGQLLAQSQAPSAAPNPAGGAAYGSQPSSQLLPVLAQIEKMAQQTNIDLAQLRIEKWKTDSDTKRQSQTNSDSIRKNLSAALPEMITGVGNAPDSLAPVIKLYRDLNALYDVFSGLTESAGAFGPKDDYRALASDGHEIDTARLALVDYLENAAAFKDAQLQNLLAQAAAAKPATVTKKIVDDNEPDQPVRKKKKAAKPAAQKTAPQPPNPTQ